MLPGLDGRWWFDEMPWLTPFVRQAIAEKVLNCTDLTAVLGDRPQGYLRSTTKARQWLWDVATRCRGSLSPCQQKLLDQLKAISDDRSGPFVTASQPLEDALKQFVDAHPGDWSAADLHTVAVLQQAGAHGQMSLQDKKKQYNRALTAYASESRRPSSTYALCEFDAAICFESLPQGADDAKRRIDELLGANELPVLFHVCLLVERGRLAAASTAPGEYEELRFTYANKLLDGYLAAKRPMHPLAAYIAESCAATLVDQWKVDEAAEQYKVAHHIRLTNKDDSDPLTAIFVFRDRRASALVARYRGILNARGTAGGLSSN